MTYSDEQINGFLELAQEVGITRAKRELGYPNSWGTAKRWADLRGVEVNVDEIRQKAAVSREWYKTEEVLTVAQEGMQRVYQELVENSSLTPDDQKKLAEALQKHFNVWSAAQGKAQTITETRDGASDEFNAHLQDLLNSERAKNQLKKENVTE